MNRVIFAFLGFMVFISGAVEARSPASLMGVGVGFWSTSVADADGADGKQSVAAPLFFYSFNGSRDVRYRAELSYLSGQIDATAGTVNQDFTSLVLGATMQTRWRIGRSWKPWVGAGVSVLNSEFTNRYVADQSGFLVARFKDRSQIGYSLTLTASHYWEVGRSTKVGIDVLADIPLSADLRRLGIGISLVF